MQLFLEDLQVGQRFSSGEYLITEERMKAFAAEFDPQPFHLDEVAGCQRLANGRYINAADGHRRNEFSSVRPV